MVKIRKSKSEALPSLQCIIENMPGYVYWKNSDSVYMGCNKNLAKVSNLAKPEDIIGKTDYDFDWGAKQADQFVKDDQNIMQTERTLVTEYQLPIKREDGNFLYVRTDKMPLYNEKNKVVGVLAVAVDITDQNIIEQQLKDAKEKAEMLNHMKTEFINNMEHDIRTPFSGIWGMANYLLEQETDVNKKEFLNDISKCAKELLDYCNGIMEYTKLERGALPSMAKKFSIKDLLNRVINIEKPAATHKQLHLSCKIDPKLPEMLIGDHYRLYRILLNLVSNAVKFTHNGSVAVEVNFIKIDSSSKAIVSLSVQDTGIGIEEDKINYLYEDFVRVAPTDEILYRGIGLGLKIVKKFIIELGGEIDVISTVGEGSKFTCILPLKIPLEYKDALVTIE